MIQLEQQLKDAGLTFDCYKCHTSGSISQGCSYCDVKGTINHDNETIFVQVGDNLRGKTIGVSSVRINFEGMEDYIESNTAYGDLANKVRSIAGAYGGLIMPDDKDYIVVSMGENAAIPYREVCPNCNGSMFEQITCPICLGEGKTDTEYIVCPECNGMNYSYSTCDDCQGLGHKTCTNCNGLGTEQCYECGSDGVYDDHQTCQDCGSWVYPNSETGECICSCGSSNFSNTCMSCNGSGQNNCYVCSSSGQEMCSPCMGMGQQYGKCKNCDGEGYVAKMKGE